MTVLKYAEVSQIWARIYMLNVYLNVFLFFRFLSRPDVKKFKLPEFVDWCLIIINSADSECGDFILGLRVEGLGWGWGKMGLMLLIM